jgi:hypothetical protein
VGTCLGASKSQKGFNGDFGDSEDGTRVPDKLISGKETSERLQGLI